MMAWGDTQLQGLRRESAPERGSSLANRYSNVDDIRQEAWKHNCLPPLGSQPNGLMIYSYSWFIHSVIMSPSMGYICQSGSRGQARAAVVWREGNMPWWGGWWMSISIAKGAHPQFPTAENGSTVYEAGTESFPRTRVLGVVLTSSAWCQLFPSFFPIETSSTSPSPRLSDPSLTMSCGQRWLVSCLTQGRVSEFS